MVANFVEAVGKGFIATRRLSKDAPEVHRKLVSARCRLAFGDSLERTNYLDSRFDSERQCIVGFRL